MVHIRQVRKTAAKTITYLRQALIGYSQRDAGSFKGPPCFIVRTADTTAVRQASLSVSERGGDDGWEWSARYTNGRYMIDLAMKYRAIR